MLTPEQLEVYRGLSMEDTVAVWDRMEADAELSIQMIAVVRYFCMNDLFYLLVRGCGRIDLLHQFFFDRCREVEKNPDNHLDLWAREHAKSSIITFGLTIQNILNNPEITIGIFSHTRPIAKAFLRQIMREFEGNKALNAAFPDILWGENTKAAPKWSEDDGIVVNRRSNPKEATIEAWGLVDGQPTSKHYDILVYDDIVVQASVTSPEMIQKTMTALEQSYNLGKASSLRRRFIGTRWHYNDAYKTIKDRGTAEPREYPGRKGGTEDGESYLWSDEIHLQKRRDMGPYTYACFSADTKILMADWLEKPISEIVVGDSVVGYSFPKGDTKDKLPKSSLVKTEVVAIMKHRAMLYRFRFESGRSIDCTRDHKFFTGRRGKDIGGNDTHLAYVQLGFEKCELKGAISVYDPRFLGCGDENAAHWLSGLWDGEGSVSAGAVCISQSPEHNPLVCARIEKTLDILGFDYGTHERPAHISNGKKSKAGRIYYLRGGRQEKMRFLNICRPARSHKIVSALFDTGTRNFGKSNKDKLVSIEILRMDDVYNIQTKTGNYIAGGYAVKNCQILLNPKSDDNQGFKREWLRHYEKMNPRGMNTYLLVDAASSKKKGSDYTAMFVIGLSKDNNYYILDMVRDRLNLTQRGDRLFELHRKWRPLQTRYERYGMMADIEHYKARMEQENYRFDIIEVGGQTSKNDRIGRLIPLFFNGRVYLPRQLFVTDWQRQTVDLVQSFVEEEFMAFPFSQHDDMLDALARICEPDLKLVWPKEEKKEESILPLSNYAPAVAWMA